MKSNAMAIWFSNGLLVIGLGFIGYAVYGAMKPNSIGMEITDKAATQDRIVFLLAFRSCIGPIGRFPTERPFFPGSHAVCITVNGVDLALSGSSGSEGLPCLPGELGKIIDLGSC